jgi:hypothetical protein
MLRRWTLIALTSVLMLTDFTTSQAQNKSEPDPVVTVMRIKYARHPWNGLCFGILRRSPTWLLFDGGQEDDPISVFRVPCRKVKDQLFDAGPN